MQITNQQTQINIMIFQISKLHRSKEQIKLLFDLHIQKNQVAHQIFIIILVLNSKIQCLFYGGKFRYNNYQPFNLITRSSSRWTFHQNEKYER